MINYAVEVTYSDGPYVTCLTQVLEIAKMVAEGAVREDEHGQYQVGRVIEFDNVQVVWLGFPFSHKGAIGKYLY